MMSEGQKRGISGQCDSRGIVNGRYGSKYICFRLIIYSILNILAITFVPTLDFSSFVSFEQ